MTPINEKATQKIFSGLTCPYTGKSVSVRVVASAGSRPLFFCPDAFDPSIPVTDLKALLRDAGRRNGVEGAVSGANVLRCPYTGAQLSILENASGFSLTGGFRPSCPSSDPVLFAYHMRMRDGKSEQPAPAPAPRVTFVERRPERTRAAGAAPKDYSLEYAENALKPVLPRKTSVQVSGKIPGKHKRG